MKKNIAMMSKFGLGVATASLILGSGSASAVDFTASADVQNTLTVTVVQEMNFGTLFAAGANSSAISSLDLAANGDISDGGAITIGAGNTDDAPALLSLGGQQAARGSVSSNNTDFTLTVPAFTQSDLDNSGVFDPTQGVAVSVNNDPDEPAFYLTDFVVDDAVGAVISAGGAAGEFDVAPDFGVNDVEFGIGATINTDGAGGNRTDYQEATYSGTFEVTASF